LDRTARSKSIRRLRRLPFGYRGARRQGDAIAATIDVTSEPEWMALIAKAVANYGRLDILVNNAGISGNSVGDPDGLEGWERVLHPISS
jgi:NAD(P)-dependent dehydrogenase (short-subunit alcohol dehydrogenase family)